MRLDYQMKQIFALIGLELGMGYRVFCIAILRRLVGMVWSIRGTFINFSGRFSFEILELRCGVDASIINHLRDPYKE